MGKKLNLMGQRFGRLVVIKEVGRDKHKKVLWACVCDCGNINIVGSTTLKSGNTKSCGCLQRDRTTTHGKHRTPEYRVWAGMLQRCTNPNDSSCKNYGGRGIMVCVRWFKFENFIEDMGKRPAPELTLERINNDKGYSPENCKWATRTEQRRNTRPRKNKTGATGISWDEQRKKYLVQVGVNCKQIHLGRFTKLSDAVAARKAGEAKYWNNPSL